jgi:hypothetical protein
VTETWFGGQIHRREATSCRYPDGSWQVYTEDRVEPAMPEPLPPPPLPRHTHPRDRYRPLPPPPAPMPSCRLLGFGPYRGMDWNFRLEAEGRLWDAVDDLYTILIKLDRLESQGVCARSDRPECSMIGRGPYRERYWSSRLLVGGEIIEGSNQPDYLLQTLEMLRMNGVCR